MCCALPGGCSGRGCWLPWWRLLLTAQVLSIVPNKKELGRLFKKDAKLLAESLEVSPCSLLLAQGPQGGH